jgi:broad specificity phosphatase PhoE/nicotinamide riboside kinase
MFDPVTEAALPSRWTLHLHLLRHGEVDTGGQRLAYGHLDLAHTPRGRAEVDALLDHARRRLPRPDGVFTSDLGRCRGVAERLAGAWGVPLRVEPALREQHMGAWEGRSWRELTEEHEPRVQAFWNDYVGTAPPGGESLGDVRDRVDRWLAATLPSLQDGRWVIVTHIGVIRALLCRALGLPLTDALRLAPARGSHTALTWAEAGGALEILGEVPALPRAPRQERPPRLALSGSAGTGKTTLGRRLAAALEVPFIEEGMRQRIEDGLDVHALGHDGLRALVQELWREQVHAERAAIHAAGGFVSDRSSIDFAAFWLHYHFLEDPGTASFIHQTLAHQTAYDRIVLLPWGALPLAADGVRSPNPWLQRLFQATLEGLLFREVEPGRLLVLPGLDDLEGRVRFVLDA